MLNANSGGGLLFLTFHTCANPRFHKTSYGFYGNLDNYHKTKSEEDAYAVQPHSVHLSISF